ncbi:bis(5'-nucleosyl)-tetraphosphatase (symmetrical) YqeK [Dactylococcopsis salina]|uniref:bis(5'-nucleosyl)-tetraphosphatase (symmetrical) n=1 Tax=Dactylococcopsis salina (strain PCC 8305) TaxID=13035 RepID=K9YVI2_DACS8|nr:bis(5'-nucleosyl)-tetraphosphatase (symmetrical) YqeK [Dactylococcopsis salina]AFZ50527.1 putative HD superfamily hydrolase of NAD metabolism [Dactylococcopsis salina PCC 8305]
MVVEREKVIAWLEENVPSSRVQHILGVEEMSKQVAKVHAADEEKAQTAGLMHDLAKYFPADQLLAMAQEKKIVIDEICAVRPHLLHADVSAIVAEDTFHVKDEEILRAIAEHTLGNAEMSKISCIVFVADKLEPNRGDDEELNAMREATWESLYRGVYQVCDVSIKKLIQKGRPIHPRTVATRNWAMQATKV